MTRLAPYLEVVSHRASHRVSHRVKMECDRDDALETKRRRAGGRTDQQPARTTINRFARGVIAAQMTAASANKLIDGAIAEVDAKLH